MYFSDTSEMSENAKITTLNLLPSSSRKKYEATFRRYCLGLETYNINVVNVYKNVKAFIKQKFMHHRLAIKYTS